MSWYKDSYRRILLDLHFPEWDDRILSRFDAKEIVGNFIRANADCGIYYAKDHYGNAYYNTKVGHKHRCIGERDIFGECVMESKKMGLWTIAWYSLVWEIYASRTHPEWAMKDNKGNLLNREWPWPHVCFNSGYKNYLLAQVGEIIEGYRDYIDGFMFDMLIFNWEGTTCYCDNCKQIFSAKTGKEIPLVPSWDQTWREFLEFRFSSTEKFARDVVTEIKKIAPNLSVIFNYHGSPGFDWKVGQRPIQHILFNDYGTGEAYSMAFGTGYPGMESRFLRGLVKNRPFEVLTSRFHRSDYSINPVNHLKWEVFTFLSNGAAATVVDQPFPDGSLDPIVYDRIGDVYQEAREKRELFGGTPLKYIGLYYSVKTRDWYGRGDIKKTLLSFNGAYKALVESHLPVDILHDENIGILQLDEYPVILLANVAILNTEEAERFRKYVYNGGTLIITDETGLYDENGHRLKDFILGDLMGVKFVGKTKYDFSHFKVGEGPFGNGIDPRYHVLCIGHGNIIEGGEKAVGELRDSFCGAEEGRFFSHLHHPPGEIVGPALVTGKKGKGRVIYVPFRLCASYASEYSLPEQRLLIRNIVLETDTALPITVEAPLNVECVVTKQEDKNRFVIHFIGLNLVNQVVTHDLKPPLLMEEPPFYRARVNININHSNVGAFNNPHLQKKGNVVEITCQKVHEAVIINL